jgi:hypothetical protein
MPPRARARTVAGARRITEPALFEHLLATIQCHLTAADWDKLAAALQTEVTT